MREGAEGVMSIRAVRVEKRKEEQRQRLWAAYLPPLIQWSVFIVFGLVLVLL